MNENKKSKIWVYAVVLFTSAFIVLLFTAYSQIKLNNNLSEYKSQVSSKENEVNKYQQNFSSAQEMNLKLNNEIKRLEEEISTVRALLTELANEKEKNEAISKRKKDAIDELLTLTELYLNGNAVECAGRLKSMDTADLEAKQLDTYNTLSAKAYAEAGNLLYNEGYALYNKGEYDEAREKLLLSHQYAPAQVFSDKCLYYLAYSEVKTGKNNLAVEHMNLLINHFPSSKYVKSAKQFINKYKQ